MEGIKRLFNFGLGGAIGTAVGVIVGSLLAPQSGKELQHSTQRFVDEVKAGGDAAQAETEAQIRARFRNRVGDPTAMTETSAKA
ncbi:MAG TPA: YtxH domain-containing protein [Thermomicrobiales bacterium]|nr:YtxH domain-containing protein [Thermomicrobiales bacterium]